MQPLRPRLPASLETEAERFIRTMPYDPEAFLVDDILEVDTQQGVVRARMDSTRPMPLVELQRGDPSVHPRHVPGPVLVLVTGNLGLVHAYFQHGVRFDEGWIGFGARIHRADFKRLALIGPPIELESKVTKARIQPDRHVVRYEFTFMQAGKVVYWGDQTATWLRGRNFDEEFA